ncbi:MULTISPECIES: RMD1 family protein [Legionella]|uniref:RMD1 family protein n=1 Tax=Legionella septentrionalis TaxID=2498109 RepID=A0A3S0VBT2_9GAMM|nr:MULTISPECIES: RMD1 family protein [Legionella]MCP0914750.1 RMD1 family protein [Legionella sp. 27cVA30]RUQ91107.1 RMD1 family protein [Legionella septentrionalis]RUR02824.1 RMD1 family protein [Legionella septentrionalis]RUR11422.1 RMD1 family protein [Legionella septentrionalis]RUR15103.1 RMD1 family protein [Legionella septentrionalis]
MECLSYCIANSIDLTRLDNHYKTKLGDYASTRSRDTLKLNHHNSNTTVFVFKNGTVVSWGVKRHQIHAYLDTIRLFADKPINLMVHDEFSYQISDRTAIEPHDYFDVDCISIDTESDDLKLSLSYGFSQSVKLQYFETILEALIEKYTPLIHSLSTQGAMRISRKQIRQVIGEILGAKSEMNLISNFLYHPKFFWQHPTLEEYYTMLERYLHMQRRVNAINHRLDTLNEIFDMFNGYLENRHAHSLEVIIIILIAIEIIFNVANFHF